MYDGSGRDPMVVANEFFDRIATGEEVTLTVKPPFKKSDFINGDIKGYAFDNRIKPKGAPWATQEKKAKSANDLAVFLEAGCPRNLFTEEAYYGLNQHMFGHIAEFSIHGFYNVWFSTPEARANWVWYARDGGAYGFHALEERPDLWGDVERKIVSWLDESGVGDRLVEAGRSNTERTERAQLRELLAKYPDERNASA